MNAESSKGNCVAPSLLRGATIFCLSPVRWDALYQRHQQIMSRMARHNLVLFIDPFTPLPEAVLRQRVPRPVRRISPGLLVLSSLSLATSTDYPRLQAGLLKRVASRASGIAARMNPGGPRILWLARHDCWPLKDHLKPDLVCYDCADAHWAFSLGHRDQELHSGDDQWSPPPESAGRRAQVIHLQETETLKQADLVFAVSETLVKRIGLVNKSVHHVGNAADKSLFDYSDRKPVRARGERGAIGFAGALFQWVDLELLTLAAREFPERLFIAAGPVRPGCHRISIPENLCFAGTMDYRNLPGFMAGLDLGIIPFRVNDLTRASDPIKAYEYLAMGLPVLSTPIYPGQGAAFSCHLSIGKTTMHFIRALELLLAKGEKGDDPALLEERRASVPDWDDRCLTISSLLREALG